MASEPPYDHHTFSSTHKGTPMWTPTPTTHRTPPLRSAQKREPKGRGVFKGSWLLCRPKSGLLISELRASSHSRRGQGVGELRLQDVGSSLRPPGPALPASVSVPTTGLDCQRPCTLPAAPPPRPACPGSLRPEPPDRALPECCSQRADVLAALSKNESSQESCHGGKAGVGGGIGKTTQIP